MDKNKIPFEMHPEEFKILNPKDFLKVSEENRNNIEEVRFVSPKLGQKHFGKLFVKFKFPVWSLKIS